MRFPICSRKLGSYKLFLFLIYTFTVFGGYNQQRNGVYGSIATKQLIRNPSNRANNEIIDNDWIIVFKKGRITNVIDKVEEIVQRAGASLGSDRVYVAQVYSSVFQGIAIQLPKLRHQKRWNIITEFLEDDDVDYVEQVCILAAFVCFEYLSANCSLQNCANLFYHFLMFSFRS